MPRDHTGEWLASLRTYRVPFLFWADSHDCECDVGFDLGYQSKRCFIVMMTMEQARELYSRAVYYVDAGSQLDPSLRGLQTSARATMKALRAQGVKP